MAEWQRMAGEREEIAGNGKGSPDRKTESQKALRSETEIKSCLFCAA